jgi:hypothetical protein
MAWLTLIEAAGASGFSVELIEKLTKHSPKSGESRTLPFTEIDGSLHVDDKALQAYCEYLREPWPLPKKGQRPLIPSYIRDDVKAESHFSCAICGAMDNGEIAHIEASSRTYDNSPDNLLLLCPNHHAKYDLGFAPASNVSPEVIRAAKEMKRASRRRMLRAEDNVITSLRAVLRRIELTEQKVAEAEDPLLRETYVTELKSLVAAIPSLAQDAELAGQEDRKFTGAEAAVAKIAPELFKQSQLADTARATESTVRDAAQSVVTLAAPVLALDEVDCPRCLGSGQTGLMGDLCAYCKGSCFVSHAQADAYDPEAIDEVDCPRCAGRGQTGLMDDLCAYCKGSCFISQAQADAYDPEAIDEVDCPRCEGRGQTGLMGETCAYCRGSCFISQAQADAYDPEAIDEVDCPRCLGSGQTGLIGDTCGLCKGHCYVSNATAEAYAENR